MILRRPLLPFRPLLLLLPLPPPLLLPPSAALASSSSTTSKCCSKRTRKKDISLYANCCPRQMRGPALKGKKMKGLGVRYLWSLSSRKRSGSNSSAVRCDEGCEY